MHHRDSAFANSVIDKGMPVRMQAGQGAEQRPRCDLPGIIFQRGDRRVRVAGAFCQTGAGGGFPGKKNGQAAFKRAAHTSSVAGYKEPIKHPGK